MADLKIVRWRRYGKDRLYVNDATGARAGWVDLQAGALHVESPEVARAVRAAIVDYCSQHRITPPDCCSGAPRNPVVTEQAASDARRPPAAHVAPTADPVAASATPPAVPIPDESARPVMHSSWEDLALNVPGQAARAQADAELAEMRDRGRVGTFLARAFDIKTDERAWRIGAGGEETVGAKLEKLTRHGWHVLHAVPVGDRGSDIDHVVIGPGGVWTVNTKTHPGKSILVDRNSVRVDGHRQRYLRNSRFEAERATRLLSEACGFPVFVRAALVFLTGTLMPDVTVKDYPDDVAVLDRMDIPGVFRRAKRKLTDEQVAAVYEQARRSTTWRSRRR